MAAPNTSRTTLGRFDIQAEADLHAAVVNVQFNEGERHDCERAILRDSIREAVLRAPTFCSCSEQPKLPGFLHLTAKCVFGLWTWPPPFYSAVIERLE